MGLGPGSMGYVRVRMHTILTRVDRDVYISKEIFSKCLYTYVSKSLKENVENRQVENSGSIRNMLRWDFSPGSPWARLWHIIFVCAPGPG